MKIVLISLIMLLIGSVAYSQTDKRLKGIEKELNEVIETWETPGFAVAVVEKDRILYAKGFGYRNVENKIPVDENTLFAIGSCSKSFTTSLLGILEREGKLSLDDRPSKHIQELKFYNEEMNNMITLRDMMCHRTGLPRHDISWYLFPTYSKDSLVMRMEYQEAFAGVREKWRYNNFMFMAQGVVAERITGKTWEENVREKIFEPLGMVRSNFSIKELEQEENRALGYKLKDDGTIEKDEYYKIAGMAPAGSINSSVKEMSNWLITWIMDGKFKGKEVIPSAFVNQAISSQSSVSGALPNDEYPDIFMSNYGYGWGISSYKGHYRVSHGGGIDGFTAVAGIFPKDSIGIVVLTNQGGSRVAGIVRGIVADRMLGTEKTNWNQKIRNDFLDRKKRNEEAEKNKESDQVAGTRPSHNLQEYTGEYNHPGYGKFRVVLRNDSVFAQFPYTDLWLDHYHYDIFASYPIEKGKVDTDTEWLKFNFRTNNIGEISSLEVEFEGSVDPIEFDHQPNLFEVDMEVLEKYVGEYELGQAKVKVYVKDNKELYMFINGQPEYQLLATGPHKFSIKILEGFKVEFVEGENGDIVELKSIQPNGTYTGKKI